MYGVEQHKMSSHILGPRLTAAILRKAGIEWKPKGGTTQQAAAPEAPAPPPAADGKGQRVNIVV